MLMKNFFLIVFITFAFIPELVSQVEQPPPDTTEYEIDEVIITGTRTKKKIIDIPFSVTRIDKSQYKYTKKNAIDDVLGSVPGLFMQSRYGNHDVRISIRGFGSRSNSGIRGVRILLDDIPESEPDGQTRIEAIDFHSVGRIEIVKGNSSSLYTNAPGGVINFINDIDFINSFAINFNDAGSFGLRNNGIKAGVRTNNYGLLTTYNYHTYQGYRKHSEDYWHILNTVLETTPPDGSNLKVLGYFVDGLIKLPGSLTRAEFDADPFQAAQREVDFDFRRVTKKGRVGLRWNKSIGSNELELTAYGTMKYFERTSNLYRIINRNGIGASARFVNYSLIAGLENEFSAGGDLLYQTGPVEIYNNINGRKGDLLLSLVDESISNNGLYYSNTLTLVKNKLDLLLTGRYDRVLFNQIDQLLNVRSSQRTFDAFTPKFALNFKITPTIAFYTSYGYSFDSPAGNELANFPTSSDPGLLINPDLNPQKSKSFEVGTKGNLLFGSSRFFRKFFYEITFFNTKIEDEIVPFDVFGDVYYRNSAKTNRTGLEAGANIEIVPGLKFEPAYTYSDFKYDEYIARTIEFDTTGNIIFIDRDFSGNIVPSVPGHNLYLSLSYERKLTNNLTGFIKGSYRYVSKMYVDDRNTAETPPYSLLNTTLGFDMQLNDFNILLSGGINNIADKLYVGFVNINSASNRFYEAGEPRNYFISLNLGYNFK
jgi:iron complex outermembrane receptor protein